MTNALYGATTRQPVYSGKRRIPGLYERTTTTGSVFEAAVWIDGRTVRRRLSAQTKTDAMHEIEALKTDLRRGDLRRSPQLSPTLAELADDYVEHLRSRIGDPDPKRRRSPRTVEQARYKLDRYVLPTLGRIRAAELTTSDVVRFLDVLGRYESTRRKRKRPERLSANTRTGVLAVLSGLVRYGVKCGVVAHNVVRDVDRDDRPGTARLTEPRYLDEEQLALFLDHLGDTFRPIAATYGYAGLRASEALGLRWRDLDLDAGTLRLEYQLGLDGKLHPLKTEWSRAELRLLPVLQRELVAHRRRQREKNIALVQPDALVFVTKTGAPQSERNVLRALYAAGDAAGLNGDGRERIGIHDLRHSFVALALDHGLTLPEASALARHADTRVTAQVYAGLTEKARQQVTQKLLDAGFGA